MCMYVCVYSASHTSVMDETEINPYTPQHHIYKQTNDNHHHHDNDNTHTLNAMGNPSTSGCFNVNVTFCGDVVVVVVVVEEVSINVNSIACSGSISK